MALSRRLFIGGLLAAAAAPAIITSKGFKPAVGRGLTSAIQHIDEIGFHQMHYHGTATGRMSSSEPAWQELRRARPYQRDFIKQVTFGARYGTAVNIMRERNVPRGDTFLANLDYSELERRVIAQRETRGLFDDLKIR